MSPDPNKATVGPGGIVNSEEVLASLRMAYPELCKTFLAIDDLRMKLLGFLPLATGAGILLLLEGKVPPTSTMYLLPTGVFGALITAALFVYEHVGIKRCGYLIEAGKQMECRMGIADVGQFCTLPPQAEGYLYEGVATLIYSSVFAAWIGVAGLSASPAVGFWCAVTAFATAWSISFVIPLIVGKKTRKRRQQR